MPSERRTQLGIGGLHPADRPPFVHQSQLDKAAEAFVLAIGTENAEYFRKNIRLTLPMSDVFSALQRALIHDFNVVRQEQIRRSNEARRTPTGDGSAQ